MFNQETGHLIVLVLGCRQQRAPAVAGGLIHVGTGVEQHARSIDAAGAGGVDQCGQLATIGLTLAKPTEATVVTSTRTCAPACAAGSHCHGKTEAATGEFAADAFLCQITRCSECRQDFIIALAIQTAFNNQIFHQVEIQSRLFTVREDGLPPDRNPGIFGIAQGCCPAVAQNRR